MAIAPITTRLNTPVDDIGDKALERARRDFQETVRNTNLNSLQTRTQTETGSGSDQRRRGVLPDPDSGISARIAPADPRDRARVDNARRARGAQPASDTNAVSPAPRAPVPLTEPIGPPIPKELLPQLPTPPPGSSLVGEGLSGRSDLIHRPGQGLSGASVDAAERSEPAGLVQSRPERSTPGPGYRLNSATPPEIASRIAAFMRTGQLDSRPFAVTPIPGLIPDDAKTRLQTQIPGHSGRTASARSPAQMAAPEMPPTEMPSARKDPVASLVAMPAMAQAAESEPVDLFPGSSRNNRPRLVAPMPADAFLPSQAAERAMPDADPLARGAGNDEAGRHDAPDGAQQAAYQANPFFAETPDFSDLRETGSRHAPVAVNPLFSH